MAERASSSKGKSKGKAKKKTAAQGEIVDLAKARRKANKAAATSDGKPRPNDGRPSEETVVRHTNLIRAAIALKDKAKAAYNREQGKVKEAWNLAKTENINTKSLRDFLEDDARDHGQVVIDYQDKGYYARANDSPLGTQFNLWGEAEMNKPVIDVAMQGYRAGKAAEARDGNPHSPGTAEFALWDQQYLKGVAETTEAMRKH